MTINRVPAGVSSGGVGIGGRFAPTGGTRPPAGSLRSTSVSGSFVYPPVSFSSRSDYVRFWTTADVSDTTLTNLVRARDRWRDEMVQAARNRLVAEWEAQPRIRRMARRNPTFYNSERMARANARGPENQHPPLPRELARPVAIAHQLWSRTSLVPGLTRDDIGSVEVPVPGDPSTTVREIVEAWRTEEWAPSAL